MQIEKKTVIIPKHIKSAYSHPLFNVFPVKQQHTELYQKLVLWAAWRIDDHFVPGLKFGLTPDQRNVRLKSILDQGPQ